MKKQATTARPVLGMKYHNARTGRRSTIYTQAGVDAHARAVLDANPAATIAEIPAGVGVAAIIMTAGPKYKTLVFDYDPDATKWSPYGQTSDVYAIDDDGTRVYGFYRLRKYSKLPRKFAAMLDAWEAGEYDDEEEAA